MLGIVSKAAETVVTRGCGVGSSNQTKVKSTKSLPHAAKLMGCLTGDWAQPAQVPPGLQSTHTTRVETS